jgi:Cu+-exporting ATPase
MFTGWQWWALALSAPVVTWGAWPFHRAALMNARHRATTMDTLISIGVTAASAWSIWAMVWGNALEQHAGMSMSASDVDHVYFEVAVAVTVFLLAGRYFEARAKRRAGDALRSLPSGPGMPRCCATATR